MTCMPKTPLAQAILGYQPALVTGNELALLGTQLDASGWSIEVFEQCCSELLDYAGQLQPSQRMAWVQALRAFWIGRGKALEPAARIALLTLVNEWQDWPLLEAICLQLEEWGELEEWMLLSWSQALFQMGSDQAGDALRFYLSAFPDCEFGADLRILIDEQERWLEKQELQPLPQNEKLLLIPMQHHHRDAFLWQYHDPEIAELCCLPTFTDGEQWHQWLDECYGYGDQLTLAIIHRDWGLVGQMALVMHGGVGFIYYWIGCDLRGMGLAPQAVELLLAHARKDWGLETCYAKLFDFNGASRRVLEKVGFVNLGISAVAPDEQEVFYRLGDAQSYQDSVQELHQLLVRMKSDVRIANLRVA